MRNGRKVPGPSTKAPRVINRNTPPSAHRRCALCRFRADAAVPLACATCDRKGHTPAPRFLSQFRSLNLPLQPDRGYEEEIRLILDNLQDAFYRTDLQGVFTFLSASSEKVAGYKPEEGVGHNIKEFYADPEERDLFMELMRTNGFVNGFEARLIKKNGEIVWVSTSAAFYRDRDGNIAGVQGISRDITERKRVELALRESEERYRQLAENSLTGILVHQDGKIVYMNRRAAEGLGYTPEELVGRVIWDFIVPEDRERMHATVEERLANQAFHDENQFRVLTKDGENRWVEVHATTIEHNGRLASLANVLDITDRKLQQEELQLAKNLAEAANRAKSDFLANMSHELRTPLNAIIGFSEILQDEIPGPLNDVQTQYVGYVLESGSHLLHLISEILDLSKVESGSMQLEVSAVLIMPLLEGSLSLIREKALRHNVRLELAVDDDLREMIVQADELKLRQVLLNLLSNAVKFTPSGGTVNVQAMKGHDEFLISVADSGIGIDRSDRERIFNAFEQVDASAARRHQGTGLGLALARKLVEMHGGRIWVESQGAGKGSTFKVSIPIQ